MFNFRPETDLPGFRVNFREDQPGFRIEKDGSVRRSFGSAAAPTPTSNFDPYTNALPTRALFTNFGYPSSAALYPTQYRFFDPTGSRLLSRDPILEQSGPVGSTTPDLLTNLPRFATATTVSDPGQSQYQRCFDQCYPLLERPQPRGNDSNKWDFHKCMSRCMGQ
jgi:hypothetical protein